MEGVLIISMESDKLKESSKLPKNLSGKLILGAVSYVGKWYSVSNKVTNLNIFSSFLSVEDMKSITQGKNCAKKGDYLVWEEMEWILHGKAKIETMNTNEPCEGRPFAHLFHAPFPSWDSCMHLCENMGTRTPSVTTLEDWIHLKTFLREKIYDKGLKSMQIWLPLTDKEKEGVWKDYNGTEIQNYTLPWPEGGPDGGENENCARVMGLDYWGDNKCDWPQYACMCSYNPDFYLKLRGLCPSSAIDVFYKPMNDWANFRKLQRQGLKGSSISYNDVKKIWSLGTGHATKSDGFSEKFQREGGRGTFSIQKFILEILDLHIRLFSDVFRKKLQHNFPIMRGWGVKGRLEFFPKIHPFWYPDNPKNVIFR